MTETSVKNLNRKFVTVTMSTLIVSVLLISGFLYFGAKWFNYKTIQSSLDYIISHDGDLDNADVVYDAPETDGIKFLEDVVNVGQEPQSPEFRYTARYFVIYFDTDEKIYGVRTNHISAVSEEQANAYGERALQDKNNSGQYGDYFYKVNYDSDGSGMIVYLDGSDFTTANSRLLSLVLIVLFFGILLSYILSRKFARWALKSEIRNREIQNQFMTNISHELKTPLAVILANTEMQEIITGENDWSLSTKRQVERMNGLIKSLVTIARAEERSALKDSDKVSLSEIVRETAKTYETLALRTEKELKEEIEDDVVILGDEAQIRQLAYLLLDNAIKYCDDKGAVTVSLKTKTSLKAKGHTAVFCVSNSYADGKDTDYSKFFERFYRKDTSHNIDKGGYGIGLSVAESIVSSHHGKISASWDKGIITFECQLKALSKKQAEINTQQSAT